MSAILPEDPSIFFFAEPSLSYVIHDLLLTTPMTPASEKRYLHRKLKGKDTFWKHSTAILCRMFKGLEPRRKANPLVICCSFLKFPTEIIQHIVSFLPLGSQAAVTLTNKSLLSAIGTCSWKELASNLHSIERINFLVLLESDDSAKYWFCEDCAVLHHKEGDFWRCPAFEVGIVNKGETNLRWAHIHLVMQRHFRGKDFGLPVEVFSEHRKFPPPSFKRFLREFTKHGKIVDDEVFIKAKLTIDASLRIEKAFIRICNHLSTQYLSVSQRCEEFQQLISCRLNHLQSAEKFCAFCVPVLRRCKWCAIEYDFPIRCSSKERKLEIDVWANLGSGQSRSDPKWSLLESFGKPKDEPLKYELGSIRAKYELGRMDD